MIAGCRSGLRRYHRLIVTGLGLLLGLLLAGHTRADDASVRAGKSHRHSRAVRNLPDVDVTDANEWQLQQEINFFNSGGVLNTVLDYGVDTNWNLGLLVSNAQFYSTANVTLYFQPDVMLSVERHWSIDDNSDLILGNQLGVALTGQSSSFAAFHYLNYQYQLEDPDIELDLGAYAANSVFAGVDSVGWHVSCQLPVWGDLDLNVDYWSGHNQLGSITYKLQYPLVGDWQIGVGVQRPNVLLADEWIGLLGLYWN